MRDELFRSHPQTPLPPTRSRRSRLPYFDYDPALRVLAAVEPAEREHARDRHVRRAAVLVHALRACAVRRSEERADARPVLARRLRRRHLPLVRRRDERHRDLRRVPLPARHGQGLRPRRARTGSSCSTSTSPTTRRARTTRAGSARSRRRGTGWRPHPRRRAVSRLMARAALAAALVSVIAAVPAFAASGKAYVSNCGTLEQHPAALVLACADANYALAGLKWSGWTTGSASATGSVQANDCTPNCAAGHFHSYRVRVVADRLGACKGKRVYLRLTVTYPGKRPTGYPRREPWTFTCAQATRSSLRQSAGGRPLPQVPPPDLRRGRRAGGGRADAHERDRAGQGAPGLPVRRAARHRQDVARAHPREGASTARTARRRRPTTRATRASRSRTARRST